MAPSNNSKALFKAVNPQGWLEKDGAVIFGRMEDVRDRL